MPLVGLCRPRRVTFRTSGGSRADTRGLTHASGRDPIEIKNIELGLGDEIKVLGYPGMGGERIAITSGEISGWWTSDGTEYYKSLAKGVPGLVPARRSMRTPANSWGFHQPEPWSIGPTRLG